MRSRAILLVAVMAAVLVLASGVALAVTRQCKTIDPNTGAGICYGTKEKDKLLGTDGHNVMYAKGKGDTLKGFGGADILYGQGGSDKLFGGPSNDLLYPGPGNDTSDGGEGDDIYIFEANNWGKDTITASDTIDKVEFKDIGTDLTINLVSNPDQDEVKNADGTSTINWSSSVINNIRSDNQGDDTINGNPAANIIFLRYGKGFNTVSSGGGNDYIDVTDGDGDYVDCGEGTGDVVYYDGRTEFSLGDLVENCEVKNPS